MPVALVLVSHVASIASGVRELAAQMAPDVAIAAAGGTDEGGVGTSFDKVLAAVVELAVPPGLVVLYDLGSAQMTAELALETLEPEQAELVRIVDAPLVEGALAAATAAQTGASLDVVVQAAQSAGGVAPEPMTAVVPAAEAARASFVLVNPLGLHARPAAQLVGALTGLDAVVTIEAPAGRRADGRSMLAVVGLSLRGGAEFDATATGPDADQALATMRALVESGFGETAETAEADARQGTPAAGAADVAPGTPSPPESTPEPPAAAGILRGVPGSPGTAVGRAVWLRAADPDVPDQAGADPATERARLDAALAAADHDLAGLASRGQPGEAGAIAAAHRALLTDPALRDRAYARIDAGRAAPSAWWTAAQDAASALAASDDHLVAERAADVRDVALAVLATLGVPVQAAVPDVQGAVVVTTDLVPSQVAALARAGAASLVVVGGGATAHATIIARGLGLPAVVALGRATDGIPEGAPTIVDGTAGTVHPDPPPDVMARAEATAVEERRQLVETRAAAAAPVLDATGRHLVVAANVGSREDAEAAVVSGADGVGLLRTELLFLDRAVLPTEDEQTAELVDLLSVLGGRPVVVRTLDVGADKLLPALRLDPVRHGPLGERGLRFGLAHLGILRTQLRAILRSAVGESPLSVMAPMVTFGWEARAFRQLVEDVSRELEEEGVAYGRPVEVGVMVEVPAAALAADEICAEVDFVSVGSNDLTQYVMAAERTNEAVSALYRPDHVALWRLLELLVTSTRAAGRRVAVCGEIAGDPAMAVRLVELGIDELSMAPASIPAVKAALRAAVAG